MTICQIPIRLTAVLIVLLWATTAQAGWGEVAKQAGSQAADQAATAAGLPYTPSEAVQGVKDILSLGTGSATTQLSQNGFLNNQLLDFALPAALRSQPGASNLLSSLNNVAKSTVSDTTPIFMNAIEQLNITDVTSLLGGSGSTAITQYFQGKAFESIKSLVKPIVASSIDSAGVGTLLSTMGAATTGTPFSPTDFVTDQIMNGMFQYIGIKETELRSTGGAGTTELIQKLI